MSNKHRPHSHLPDESNAWDEHQLVLKILQRIAQKNLLVEDIERLIALAIERGIDRVKFFELHQEETRS
jgi:hypothetical protein